VGTESSRKGARRGTARNKSWSGSLRVRAAAQDFGQGIGKGPWLGELDHVTVGHGVSLLHWRSGGVEHHHDTPPYPVTPSPTSRHSSPHCFAPEKFKVCIRKCRKTVARARSFPAVRHDATNRRKVLRERAAPTGKVCRCWMASSRSAARCFAVSPCDSALPPHYSSRSISGAGYDKSSDPPACRDAHPRRFLSTPSEPSQTKSRTWCAPAGQ
jgi:hypothetical protein